MQPTQHRGPRILAPMAPIARRRMVRVSVTKIGIECDEVECIREGDLRQNFRSRQPASLGSKYFRATTSNYGMSTGMTTQYVHYKNLSKNGMQSRVTLFLRFHCEVINLLTDGLALPVNVEETN